MRNLELVLRNRLKEELPSHLAHQKMMPHRQPIKGLGRLPLTAKQSAVLALLYPREEELHTVFILRSTYKGVHSGQISLPGGRKDETDLNLMNTALRETHEELGVSLNNTNVVGSLSPLYVPPSNFVIHPYVAIQYSAPQFTPEEREVAEVLECPVSQLMDRNNMVDFVLEEQSKVKGFQLNDKVIWGATGMIIKELIEVLEELDYSTHLTITK